MAASQGYQCEFIDQVGEDFYCKKCTLVARRITITTCCVESFCQTCIADVTDKCPACGEKDFGTVLHSKNQKRIGNLRVYCTVKERGCDWSGILEQLDTHLDPDQNNCQYVDTKCPLNCKKAIPKNKVEQHVSEECVKREYFCQYCSFKAIYEEVMDKHLPECVYVPLDCPNMCGVTFERDFMEDHMKICRLEEIECEFSGVGCEDRIRREDQEEHTRQNNHKHLTLTALLAVGTKEQLQEKILEQDKKIEVLEEKLKDNEKRMLHLFEEHSIEEQKMKRQLEDQEKHLQDLKKEFNEEGRKMKQKLDDQKKILEQNFDSKLLELKKLLKDFETKSDHDEKKVNNTLSGKEIGYFEMKNFSEERKKFRSQWCSPPMYTETGYKFCIAVYAGGFKSGSSITLVLMSMPGEYDEHLKWPTKAKLTVSLINQGGGKNVSGTIEAILDRVEIATWNGFIDVSEGYFIEHSKLGDYLANDTLYFLVSYTE